LSITKSVVLNESHALVCICLGIVFSQTRLIKSSEQFRKQQTSIFDRSVKKF